MKIVHRLNGRALQKEAGEDSSFILASGNGNFAHFTPFPGSKYQGFFANVNGSLFRIVESLSPVGGGKAIALEKSECAATFRRASVAEKFFVPHMRSCLAYTLTKPLPVEVFLDVMKVNDFRQWGRSYSAYERKGCLVVKFAKSTDSREDSTSGRQEFTVFVAISHNGKVISSNGEWVRRDYTLDAKRNSASERYVYKAATISADSFVVAAAASEEEAIRSAGAMKSLSGLEEESAGHFRHLCGSGKSEAAFALDSARIALESLSTGSGLYAGLPWFFQEWSRDELISCVALDSWRKKAVVMKYLDTVLPDGRIPNIIGIGSANASADSIGWLFTRASQLFDSGVLRPADVKKLKAALKKSIDGILKRHCSNGFIVSGKNETWMDTSFNDDGRAGACIEIQAMQLSMYRLMFKLTGEQTYQLLEGSLRQNVRKFFWNGSVLADRLGDYTIRPNIFIAAYVYSDLLTKKEWETCIENALGRLWLGWGGLATIDKSHSNFRSGYTGETNESYHRGDSWFWVNNIAAIVMKRVNGRKFKNYIAAIAAASAADILWKGAIGCASELSSASSQKAEGCLSQAWSNATFIEIMERY